MKSIVSTATIKKLTIREMFATHGLPETLFSTNEDNCSSSEFKGFMKRNCNRHKESPYHPSTNGLAEKAITCKIQVPYSRHYAARAIVRGRVVIPFHAEILTIIYM